MSRRSTTSPPATDRARVWLGVGILTAYPTAQNRTRTGPKKKKKTWPPQRFTPCRVRALAIDLSSRFLPRDALVRSRRRPTDAAAVNWKRYVASTWAVDPVHPQDGWHGMHRLRPDVRTLPSLARCRLQRRRTRVYVYVLDGSVCQEPGAGGGASLPGDS